MEVKTAFRDRMYAGYVNARHERVAPTTLAGLQPRIPHLRQLIRRHFPTDKAAAILDVGCGHGALVYVAQSEGYRNVSGVDTSPEQVEAARQLGIEGVRAGDLFGVLRETSTESLDVVVALDVIEHLTREEILDFMDEVHRVLRSGGRCILHTPNADSPFFGRIRYGDITHEMAFTRTSIAQVLYSSGFSALECYEDTPVAHGLKSSVRAMLWTLIRSGLRTWLLVETGAAPADCILTQNFFTVARK